MPRSMTPVGLPMPGHSGSGNTVAPSHYKDDPGSIVHFEASFTASVLAVYASQPPLRYPTTQDSLLASGQPLPHRVCTCRIPFDKFQLCLRLSTLHPPIPGLTWRPVGGTFNRLWASNLAELLSINYWGETGITFK